MVQVRRPDAGDRLRREQRRFLQPEPVSSARGEISGLLTCSKSRSLAAATRRAGFATTDIVMRKSARLFVLILLPSVASGQPTNPHASEPIGTVRQVYDGAL